MKKILSLILALVLMLSVFSSCASPKIQNDKILLVTSFYPVYIFTLNVVDGIDEIEVKCMAEQNTGCLHDYQILSRDAKLIAELSSGLGEAMVGINEQEIAVLMAERGK